MNYSITKVSTNISGKRNILRLLSPYLNKKYSKWFAAIEQSGLSGSNFLYSALVLIFGGVIELGEYGFWFVVCQLLAMSVIGITIRQMVLQSANSAYTDQLDRFGATLRIVFWLQWIQATVIILLVAVWPPEQTAIAFAVSLIIYVLALNLSELLRQYLYMRNQQRLSVCYTAAAQVTGVALFYTAAVGLHADHIGQYAFLFLAIGHGLFAAIALIKIGNITRVWHRSRKDTFEVLRNNWKHGKLATAGMAVTWLQNQSVTPILMLIFGPLSVGYYQIARMVITPVNMVTAGLSKSALPQSTRSFGNGGIAALTASISEHLRLSNKIVFGYVLAVISVGVAVALLGYGKNWPELVPMFASTIVVMILSNYRSWYSQFFIVRMQFNVLLRAGIVGSALALLAMFAAGYGLRAAYLLILGSAIGEIYLIIVLKRRIRADNANEY